MRRSTLAIAVSCSFAASTASAVDLLVPTQYATIQGGVDAAVPGDRVLIAPGSYSGTVTVAFKDGLTIEGDGEVVLTGTGGDGLLLDNVKDCAIRGLTFSNHDRALRLEESGGVSIRDCRFEQFGSHGVMAASCLTVRITDCRFVASPTGTAVRGVDARQLIVDDCRIEKVQTGVWMQGADLAAIVERNDFVSVPWAVSISGSAALLHANDAGKGRLYLSGDALRAVDNDCGRIDLGGAVGCILLDNRVDAGGGVGIEVFGSENLIARNRVTNASTGYLSSSDNLFAYNDAAKCATGFDTSGIMIGNRAKKCSVAKFVEDAYAVYHGNDFGPSDPAGHTLKVPSQYASIQYAVDAAKPGDRILVSDGTYPESVVVTGKTDLEIAGKGKVVLAGNGSGIGLHVTQSSRVRVAGLRFEAHERGLVVEQSRGAFVEKCGFEGFASYGLQLEKVTGALVAGCRFAEAPGAVGLAVNYGLGVVSDDCRTTKLGYAVNYNHEVVASLICNWSVKGKDTYVGADGAASLVLEVDANGAELDLTGSGAAAIGNRARNVRVSGSGRQLALENRFVGAEDLGIRVGAAASICARNAVEKAALFGLHVQSAPGALFAFNELAKCSTGVIVASDQIGFVGNVAKKSALAHVGQVLGEHVYFVENSFDGP